MTDRPVVECWGKFYNAFLMEKEVGPERLFVYSKDTVPSNVN